MRFFLIISLSLFGLASYTQEVNKKLTKADKLYNDLAFSQAAELYEDLAKKFISTEHVSKKLAYCYLKMNQPDKAEKWFAKVMEQSNKTTEDIYNYSWALRSNKKQKDADIWMDKFSAAMPTDSRAQRHKNQVEIRESILADNDRFNVYSLSINSEQSDYSPAFWKDKLIFVSGRPNAQGILRKHSWGNEPFSDLYSVKINEDGTLYLPIPLPKSINTGKFHEGAAVFTKFVDRLYFTRNNYYQEAGYDEEGVTKLKLYYIDQSENGEWKEVDEFPYNSDNYSIGDPAISADGKTLIFTSDMPGSIGKTDLWYSKLDNAGNWSKPVNLGPEINTEGEERFPFIHENGNLFFSSNGHVGLGGLDIYLAPFNNEKYGDPVNLGSSINSNKDDFGFILGPDEKKGYFSSNRDGGRGKDDIYGLEMKKPFELDYFVSGKVKNKLTGDIIPFAKVVLFGAGEQISDVMTNESGEYKFKVEKGSQYVIQCKKEGFFDGKSDVNGDILSRDKNTMIVDVMIEQNPGLALYGTVLDHKTNTPIDGANVIITDKATGEVFFQGKMPKNGAFSKPIEGKKIGETLNYYVQLGAEGYLGKSMTFSKKIEKAGKINLNETLSFSLDKIEVGTDIGKIIDIQPIYFDVNKHDIRQDAALELDKVVQAMKDNPNIVIELGSHTDSRGSANYNRSLSDKRAKSSAQYVIDHGIGSDRIYGKGYGEAQIINRCKDGVRCSKEEHQANRRTEFKIVKM
ncbi:MAG: OmpA family protein [Flavobacteriales bacterium]|nr:OmpA family protein [Flavobacteriales bacterium]